MNDQTIPTKTMLTRIESTFPDIKQRQQDVREAMQHGIPLSVIEMYLDQLGMPTDFGCEDI